MKAKFIGQVRGYSIDDNGDVHLTVEDTEISQAAMYYVHDLERSFNPNSNVHGFGSKDVPCNIRPGLASYYFTVKEKDARGIAFGSTVEVEIDIFQVRKVKFFQKRWGGIVEMRQELVSIRPVSEKRQDAKPEAAADKK